jgi:hypothetical protein
MKKMARFNEKMARFSEKIEKIARFNEKKQGAPSNRRSLYGEHDGDGSVDLTLETDWCRARNGKCRGVEQVRGLYLR